MRVVNKLLWIDCTAAALAGVVVLVCSGWLSQWYALPRALLLFVGVVNLLYASCSFSLAVRAKRPQALIVLLVIANGLWAAACLVMAARFAGTATFFGLAHLLGEAVFVGGLACLEWKWRRQLLTAAAPRQKPSS